jgi:GNAT superfamily N-acetyltransferase
VTLAFALAVEADGAPGVAPPGRLPVIVTYLDMRAPPRHEPLPAPYGEASVVRAAPPTVSFYRYLYGTVGEPWLWHERRRWSDTDLARTIGDPRVEVQVLWVNGTPAGFVEIDRRIAINPDIAYFGLVPDFIGFGLGPWLLDRAIRMAWSGGSARRLTVNTCTFDHPKALGLYQRLGFCPREHIAREVADPRVSGLLPPHAAPHVPIRR